jgi:hypothetical protein
MRVVFLILLSCSFHSAMYAQGIDSSEIVELLKSDYKTLESLDYKKHIEHCTEDYILIENGEIWDLKKEIDMLFKSGDNTVIKRDDVFLFKSIKVDHPYAYAVYELRSTITRNGNTKAYHWVESAIFYKVSGKWKIKLIHSTKVGS